MFSNKNEIKGDANNKRKVKNMWKLNETVPNNHGVNENKLQWKLKNILDELKQNTTNQILSMPLKYC